MSLSTIAFLVFKKDFLVTLLNFGTGIVIARKLGLEMFGIWSIFRIIISYIEAFGRTKSDQTLVYFIGKKKIKIEDALANIHLLFFINIFLLVFLLVITNQFIYDIFFSNTQVDYKFQFYFLLLSLPFSFLVTIYCYFFQAIENYSIYNNIIIVETFIKSLISIILLIFSNLGLWSLIIAYIVSPIISIIYAINKLPKESISKGKVSFKLSLRFLNYAKQFYFGSLISAIYAYGTSSIASILLLPQYIGLIAQAQKFGELINRFISPIQIPLYPLISKSSKKNAIEKVIKVFRIISLISFLITIILALLLKPFVNLFYGSEFNSIANIFYIISPGLIFESTTLIFTSYCNGIGKAIIGSTLQIFPMIIQLLFSIVLIKYFGYIGAAISISIGKILYSILFLTWFAKNNKVKILDLLPDKNDFYFVINFIKQKLYSLI